MSEQSNNKAFAILFKKFRLRSEIESLSEFGNLFADEGMVYETSLFTRWQNGERVPKDRKVVIVMIRLFVKRGGINSADEANMILEALDMRDLSNEEVEGIQKILANSSIKVFQKSVDNTGKISSQSISIMKWIERLLRNRKGLIVVSLYLLITIIWYQLDAEQRLSLRTIPGYYFIMAIIGGGLGLQIYNRSTLPSYYIKKSILMFSLGLFAQVFGQVVYLYYILIDSISVPYPSVGDLGYFGTIPLYIIGVIYLARASGVKIVLRSYSQALSAIVLPMTLLLGTYLHLLLDYQFHNAKILTVLLDFGYPLGQSIYISIAILVLSLSKGVFGEMKNRIRFIIIALISQYAADYVFIYQANEGSWVAGGFNDYMYLTSYLLMSLALLQFDNLPHTIRFKK